MLRIIHILSLLFLAGKTSILWLFFAMLYYVIVMQTKCYYIEFPNDGSKQWSRCHCNNKFHFISRVMTFTLIKKYFAGLVKYFPTVYSHIIQMRVL